MHIRISNTGMEVRLLIVYTYIIHTHTHTYAYIKTQEWVMFPSAVVDSDSGKVMSTMPAQILNNKFYSGQLAILPVTITTTQTAVLPVTIITTQTSDQTSGLTTSQPATPMPDSPVVSPSPVSGPTYSQPVS